MVFSLILLKYTKIKCQKIRKDAHHFLFCMLVCFVPKWWVWENWGATKYSHLRSLYQWFFLAFVLQKKFCQLIFSQLNQLITSASDCWVVSRLGNNKANGIQHIFNQCPPRRLIQPCTNNTQDLSYSRTELKWRVEFCAFSAPGGTQQRAAVTILQP